MTIKKPIKIHKVKSYKDFPLDRNGTPADSSVKAVAIPSKREVYVVQDQTSESDIQHEIGHVVHGDSDNWPYKPEVFVRQEIQASLYAYRQTRAPSHVLSQLRAIFNDLCLNHYQVKPKRALTMIGRYLRIAGVPKSWSKDYSLLRAAVLKSLKRREKK